MYFMQKKINQFKDYLCDYLKLDGDIPAVRDKINNRFVELVFHDNARGIFAGILAIGIIYIPLLFFNYDYKLHVWLFFCFCIYLLRYFVYRVYKRGAFLGFTRTSPRLSDIEVIVIGILIGLSCCSLVFITATNAYSPYSQYISICGVILFYSASLTLNSNVPIWYTPFALSSMTPIIMFLFLKGGYFIFASVILFYYSVFIYFMTLRTYRLNYESYFLRYQNTQYLEELEGAKSELEKSVQNLQKNNKKLSLEVSRRKQAEKNIRKLASIDVLTGVTNRVSLEEKMKRAIQNAQRTKKMVGVFFVDLDRFKFINDTFGHETGDELLKEVANRLSQCLRTTDDILRIGGDEFILLVTNVSTLEDLFIVAQNILIAMEKPYLLRGKMIVSEVSIGISSYQQNAQTPEDLIRDADVAMYRAKEINGSSFIFFTNEMNDVMVRRIKIEKWLQNALDEDGFQFFYQPIVCLKSGKVVSAELLLRFDNSSHEDLGFVGPAEFIPIAEKMGLMYKIGTWGIEEACRILKRWQNSGRPEFPVALNVSTKHLVDPNFLSHLKDAIKDSQINPALLELEITETQAIENQEFVENILKVVVGMGLRLSIDDFGTGHSNFCYLRELPVTKIKIDQSFLAGWDNDQNTQSLVQAIISISKALNLEVIAEGVETIEQLEFLKANGCDLAQGYYFCKPIPEADFLAWMDQRAADQGGELSQRINLSFLN